MTNLELVAAELEAAKKKHPKLVDEFIPRHRIYPAKFYDDELDAARWRLDRAKNAGSANFRNVLQCEVCEAISAYAHGDLAHAKQELAQCAAVCIRAMEYIEREMEAKK